MSARLKDHLGHSQLKLAVELGKMPRDDFLELDFGCDALRVDLLLSRRLIRYVEQRYEEQKHQSSHRLVLSCPHRTALVEHALLDQLVRTQQYRLRDRQPERLIFLRRFS